jgi:hypothetical protein
MLKQAILAAAVLTLSASLAIAAPINGGGKGQPSENANPLAVERATRNSDGGDREHGAFGQAQSDFVQGINNGDYAEEGWTSFGDFLQEWKADNAD